MLSCKILDRAYISLTILSLSFITGILAIISNTSLSSGYELSIFDAYPWYIWAFFCISLYLGIAILLMHSFCGVRSRIFLLGIFIALLSNALFLSLPWFRGYGFYPNGDALTHLGMMKDIIDTGHMGKENFYPIVHILGVTILYIASLSGSTLINFLFVSWTMLYITNIYLLSTSVSASKEQALLITALACPLIFSYMHTVIHPSMLAIFLLPLILHLINKSNSTYINVNRGVFAALILILAFVIVFAHPVSCMYAIALLFMIPAVKIFSLKFYNGIRVPELTFYRTSTAMAAAFFGWYLSYPLIRNCIKTVYQFLTIGHEISKSLFEDQMSILSTANLSVVQFLQILGYKFGVLILYLMLSASALLLVLKKIIKGEEINFMELLYSAFIIVGLIFSIYTLVGFTGEYEVLRVFRFFIVIAPVQIGLIIYPYIAENSFKIENYRLLVATILLIAVVFSYNNTYGNQKVVEFNWQVSKMEMAGADWFINHHDNTIATAQIGVDISRLRDLILGTDQPYKILLWREVVPSHFGYNTNASICDILKNSYLLIGKRGLVSVNILPLNIRGKAHQYGDDDMYKLNLDDKINFIYNTGDFKIWKINSSA